MNEEKTEKIEKIAIGVFLIIALLSIPLIGYFICEKPIYDKSKLRKEKIVSLQEKKDTLVIGLYIDDMSKYDKYIFLTKNGEDYETLYVEDTKIERKDTMPYYIHYKKSFIGELSKDMQKEDYKLVLPPKTKIINVNKKQIDSIIKINREKHIMEKINNSK